MAIDGIVVHSICTELKNKLIGGRVDKIYQPEKDEIVIKIRNNSKNYRLMVTSNSSCARIHFTNKVKENPISAPMFCMLLRKHLSGSKILSVNQHDFDRIIEITFECKDELRMTVTKSFIIEIMGKYSNLIFIKEDRTVIDSIRRVSENMSSVRQIYPGKKYVLPPNQDKVNPLELDGDAFIELVNNSDGEMDVCAFMYKKIQGFSALIGKEICYRAKVNENLHLSELDTVGIDNLYTTFNGVVEDIKNDDYTFAIYSDKKQNFHSIKLFSLDGMNSSAYDSISELLDSYFDDMDSNNRINQKVYGLLKNLSNKIDRDKNKLTKRKEELTKAENRDKYKIYADLLMANLNAVPEKNKVEVINYYDADMNKMMIPLNPKIKDLKINAQRYYKKYVKLKNAEEELIKLIGETKKEIDYLENVKFTIGLCKTAEDIDEINKELYGNGYLKKYKAKKANKKTKLVDKILVYETSKGHEIYVGKNNIQNDYITFKIARKNDYWFHVKGIPGSHVIVKTNDDELEDEEYVEAGRLAAYYSSGKNNGLVEVDYTKKANIKKPANAMPGFVIFESNYSMNTKANIDGIKQINKEYN